MQIQVFSLLFRVLLSSTENESRKLIKKMLFIQKQQIVLCSLSGINGEQRELYLSPNFYAGDRD